ncbi:hypothetical protein ACLKA7_011147 [Drosophila subpalustris]
MAREEFVSAVIRLLLPLCPAAASTCAAREVTSLKDTVTIPIAVLKAGETRAVNPDVEFYETKVTFKLISGSGPVYIHGLTIKDDVEVVDMEEEDDEDEAEDVEIEHPKKRAKIEQNADGKNAKNQKKK